MWGLEWLGLHNVIADLNRVRGGGIIGRLDFIIVAVKLGYDDTARNTWPSIGGHQLKARGKEQRTDGVGFS